MLPFVIRPLLTRLSVIDVPNERSSHEAPVLRGGGIAPAVGIVLAGLVALTLTPASGDVTMLIIFLAITALAAALGLVEDIRGIPVTMRAAAQLVIGLAGAAVVVATSGANGWLVLFGGIAIAGYINVANFMDGINGISGLHGLVVGVLYAGIGWLYDLDWMLVAGLLVAVGFAAFLPWNFSASGMFLGDVGSYLLGGAIAVLAVAAIAQGVSPLAVLGPVAIYLADSGMTLVRRVLAGERWYEAHRSHVYQRLVSTRFSHGATAMLVATASLLTGILSISAALAEPRLAVLLLVMALIVLALYLGSNAITKMAGSVFARTAGESR